MASKSQKNHPLLSLAQRAAKDPALLAKARANPGLRSKLNDNQLTSQQLGQRRTNQFRTDISDVTKPMTGQTLVRTAQGLVDKEYQPQEAALDARAKQAVQSRDVQQAWSKDYDTGLQGTFAGNQQAQGDANRAAQQAAVEARARALATFDEQQKAQQQRAQEDVALRGSGLDGGATQMVADAGQVGRANAAAGADSNIATVQQTGDVQSAFLRQLASAAAMHGQEAQRDIGTNASNELRDVAGKRSELAGQRGNALNEQLLKLRGDERDAYLTQRGLSDKKDQAILDAKTELEKVKSNAELATWKAQLQAQLQREGMSSREAIAAANRASADARAKFGRIVSRKNTKDRLDASGNPQSFSKSDLRSAAAKRDKAINSAIAHGTKDPKTGKDIPRGVANAQLKAQFGTEFGNAATDILYSKNHKVLPRVAEAIKRRYGIDIPTKYR